MKRTILACIIIWRRFLSFWLSFSSLKLQIQKHLHQISSHHRSICLLLSRLRITIKIRNHPSQQIQSKVVRKHQKQIIISSHHRLNEKDRYYLQQHLQDQLPRYDQMNIKHTYITFTNDPFKF